MHIGGSTKQWIPVSILKRSRIWDDSGGSFLDFAGNAHPGFGDPQAFGRLGLQLEIWGSLRFSLGAAPCDNGANANSPSILTLQMPPSMAKYGQWFIDSPNSGICDIQSIDIVEPLLQRWIHRLGFGWFSAQMPSEIPGGHDVCIQSETGSGKTLVRIPRFSWEVIKRCQKATQIMWLKKCFVFRSYRKGEK